MKSSNSATDLSPGQYINVPGKGSGSLGFPVTQNGIEGFVTCGHVVDTGMLLKDTLIWERLNTTM